MFIKSSFNLVHFYKEVLSTKLLFLLIGLEAKLPVPFLLGFHPYFPSSMLVFLACLSRSLIHLLQPSSHSL